MKWTELQSGCWEAGIYPQEQTKKVPSQVWAAWSLISILCNLMPPWEPGTVPLLGVGTDSSYWASLVAQLVRNLPAVWKTWVGKIPWRRQRLPNTVFWPGKFHGLFSPWGCKESETTFNFTFYFCIRNKSLNFRMPTIVKRSSFVPLLHSFI